VIPQSFITELLARTDIVEVVGRHVTLKRGGANYVGLCPFHGEKSPSFTVSPSKQFYHCFGCGAHGSAIGFLMAHAGLGYVEAIRELAQRLGLTVPEAPQDPEQRRQQARAHDQRARLLATLERANQFYREQLKASPRAVGYLKRRGLSGQIAARYGLGYAPPDWRALAGAFDDYGAPELVETGLVVARDVAEAGAPAAGAAPGEAAAPATAPPARRYDRLRDRITFPIRNAKGELIGFGGRVVDQGEPKYLNSPETALFRKGEELYGLYEAGAAIRAGRQALVVEGYMDVVALAQYGFEAVVATLGTACTPMQVQKLFRHCDTLVFGFDGDAAGQRAARRALQAALPHIDDGRMVKFLFLPEEHDPDSFVRAQGIEAFERMVAAALPLSRFLLQVVAEGSNLETAEGRAQALQRARPLLQAMPQGRAITLQIGDEVARMLQTTPYELRRLLGAPTAQAHAAPRAPQGTWSASGVYKPFRSAQAPPRHAAFTPPERAAISLLACPQAWAQLRADQRDWLLESAAPVADIARWLDAHPQPAALAALVADDAAWAQQGLPPAAARLREQALLELDSTELAEVQAALIPLEAERIRQRCDALAHGGLIDEAARSEFRQLQARLRQLREAPSPSEQEV
jgi:DNA primase